MRVICNWEIPWMDAKGWTCVHGLHDCMFVACIVCVLTCCSVGLLPCGFSAPVAHPKLISFLRSSHFLAAYMLCYGVTWLHCMNTHHAKVQTCHSWRGICISLHLPHTWGQTTLHKVCEAVTHKPKAAALSVFVSFSNAWWMAAVMLLRVCICACVLYV